MAAVGRRGPDVTTRVLVVVALVALSALALQARQGLDWGDLSEPVAVRWAQVIFGSAILVGLYLAARRLLRMLRQAGSARHHDTDHAEPEGEPFPLLLRLLAVAVIAAGLVMVWFIVRAIAPPPPGANDKPATPPGQGHGVPTPLDEKTILLVALVAGAAILLATYGSRWLAARREVADDEPFGSRRAEVAAVLAAVDAAEEGLRSESDPRAAVLAAYAAMAHHLARGLGRRGSSARRSDTATELLDRSVEVGLVGDAAARTLTDLFREARFSQHPMDESARTRAEVCLREVREELAVRGS
jgi:hypothetical protein